MANYKGNKRKGTKNQRPQDAEKKFKKRDSYQEENDAKETRVAGNDPSWYSHYPQLLKDAGSHSFAVPVGNKVSLLRGNYTSTSAKTKALEAIMNNQAAPGICTLNFAPTIGYSNNFDSAVNIMARNIYSYVRHVNSGHANYEPADLGMYLLALDSAYMFYSWMVRLYGSMQLFTPVNKYYPEQIVKAMGCNFADLQTNLAGLRYYINMFAAKMGSMVLPSLCDMSVRHQWMCSNIYVDSVSEKAQSYIFNPKFFYQWEEMQNDEGVYTGTSLVPTQLPPDAKYSDIVARGNALIRAITSSEDAGIISGDLLKTFGTNGIFKVAELPDTYMVQPIYNEEVLLEIQNGTLCSQYSIPTFKITQNVTDQLIVQRPYASTTDECERIALTGNRLLSLPVDYPDPATVMVASRFVTTLEPVTITDASGEFGMEFTSFGTEILLDAYITMGVWDEATKTIKFGIGRIGYYNPDTDLNNAYSMGTIITKFSMFGSHPMIMMSYGTAQAPHFVRIFDVDNYSVFTPEDISKLHDTALMSMTAIPQVTKPVK